MLSLLILPADHLVLCRKQQQRQTKWQHRQPELQPFRGNPRYPREPGPAGPTGVAGLPGPRGCTENKGEVGKAGSQGAPGPQGPTGIGMGSNWKQCVF
ncbi:hypothetical protein OS493_040673 [Desmophyllum pertusum]|uniref:Uncharacterized protein n=1 Tax=Desmophyllum pertusum TaxID=174260 RepID=A0A9W9YTK6_9CNID|nr:hypothetical protein OS493_040673 [Desmophyllum pertusum]